LIPERPTTAFPFAAAVNALNAVVVSVPPKLPASLSLSAQVWLSRSAEKRLLLAFARRARVAPQQTPTLLF
jgi:hypothetical protein